MQFGHVVMVLAPWDDPLPLTRAWCLFELYCSIESNCKFEVAMSRMQMMDFSENITHHAQESISRMLAAIDCEQSQCHKIDDQIRIFDVVRCTDGFQNINSLIFELLRDWVVVATQSLIADCEQDDESQCLRLQTSLAELYEIQGKYQEGYNVLLRCSERQRQLLGENSVDYRSLHALAWCHYHLNQPDESLVLFTSLKLMYPF